MSKKITIGSIVFVIFAIFLISIINNSDNSSEQDSPDVIAAAKYVLTQEVTNAKTIYDESEYQVTEKMNGNELSYRIKGPVIVNNKSEEFYMIIEYEDNTYKNYKLKYLKVGNTEIYNKL